MENPTYHGPTAKEAADAEVIKLDRQIAELRQQRESAMRRSFRYAGSKMLESERIASEMEPYQRRPLPNHDVPGVSVQLATPAPGG